MGNQAGANETNNDSYVNPGYTFVFEDDSLMTIMLSRLLD